MGDQAWQELIAKTPESKDAAAKAFVEKVARRVVASSSLADKKWDVRVFESKDVNAFALPGSQGGYIGVFTGLLPVAGDEAGLATVIGHEVGHVLAQHSAERVSNELLAQGALSVASGAFGSSALKGPIMAALGMGTQVGILLPYSRAQESESDEIGFMMMAKSGYDPNAALSFWERMAKSSGATPPSILSSHPATGDRITHLKQLMPKAQDEYAKSSQKVGGGDRAPASAQ